MIAAVFALLFAAADPSLDEILAAVARSQDQSEKAREQFTFRQEKRVRLLRGNGKVAREETRIYDVVPKEKGTDRHLVSVAGNYEKHGKLHPYTDPEFRHKGLDLDGDLTDDFVDDLGSESGGGGLSGTLFPMVSERQKEYKFTLTGKREVKGRSAYVVAFEPLNPKQFFWKGEMLVDAEAMRPVSIATTQNRGMPLLVKSMLGINFRDVGFIVTYAPFDGVWFPVSYGTEFKLRLFFGYARTVAMSLVNSDFKRAKVDSTVTFAEVK